MESKTRNDDPKDRINRKIEAFVSKDLFKVLQKGTKVSEKEAEQLLDRFVTSMTEEL